MGFCTHVSNSHFGFGCDPVEHQRPATEFVSHPEFDRQPDGFSPK